MTSPRPLLFMALEEPLVAPESHRRRAFCTENEAPQQLARHLLDVCAVNAVCSSDLICSPESA